MYLWKALSGLYDSCFKCKFCFGVLRLKIIIPCLRRLVLLLKINVNVEASLALCCSAQRTDLIYGWLSAGSVDWQPGWTNRKCKVALIKETLDRCCFHCSVCLCAPSRAWTALIVSDSEVVSPGHRFVHRWPASTLFVLLLVLNAACQVLRARTLRHNPGLIALSQRFISRVRKWICWESQS